MAPGLVLTKDMGASTPEEQEFINPGPKHWAAVKHLLRYLKGTIDHKLHYSAIARILGALQVVM
ncbi:hypothetical protein HYPSUDRAFT_209942 [Hypholoma sublateritium FD-334 SS-4]|uniref:Reverse transcriptase Ty1/copia-type domain-containing protein n=1 Tax=Hypholoma sublateritium (strain FD-334 SS-4) TaxID=945553 RepID=A0A0D2KEP4_HYPSF|nr:hypothetical protein HYPSUDRAFT_209942 [Hypholoma sublateritium FD-334 SS-4]